MCKSNRGNAAQRRTIDSMALVALIFGVVGYFLGFQEFAKLSLGFAFFNMIPLSNLDGNKIFMKLALAGCDIST